jgi:hypothetical protein
MSTMQQQRRRRQQQQQQRAKRSHSLYFNSRHVSSIDCKWSAEAFHLSQIVTSLVPQSRLLLIKPSSHE